MKKKTNISYIIPVTAIFAVVLIAFFVLPHGKSEGSITIFGLKLKFSGNNQPASQAGVKIQDATAGGNIRLTDSTGKGIDGTKLKADGDIDATSSSTNSPPK